MNKIKENIQLFILSVFLIKTLVLGVPTLFDAFMLISLVALYAYRLFLDFHKKPDLMPEILERLKVTEDKSNLFHTMEQKLLENDTKINNLIAMLKLKQSTTPPAPQKTSTNSFNF